MAVPLLAYYDIFKNYYANTQEENFYIIGSGPKKLDGLRLLKEFLYEVICKNEFGEDIYVFERFLDYQTILELKKFNAEGNFDRISSLILFGIYRDWETDRKSTRLNSSHSAKSRMPSSA